MKLLATILPTYLLSPPPPPTSPIHVPYFPHRDACSLLIDSEGTHAKISNHWKNVMKKEERRRQKEKRGRRKNKRYIYRNRGVRERKDRQEEEAKWRKKEKQEEKRKENKKIPFCTHSLVSCNTLSSFNSTGKIVFAVVAVSISSPSRSLSNKPLYT